MKAFIRLPFSNQIGIILICLFTSFTGFKEAVMDPMRIGTTLRLGLPGYFVALAILMLVRPLYLLIGPYGCAVAALAFELVVAYVWYALYQAVKTAWLNEPEDEYSAYQS